MAADDDVRTPLLLQPIRQRDWRGGRRRLEDERAHLVAGQPARQRDLLDLPLAQAAREADERRGPAWQARAVHDDFVADESDDDRRRGAERLEHGARERIDAALHQRVRRRVQLRAAQRRRQPPDEVVVGERGSAIRRIRPGDFRSIRSPVRAPSSSAPAAFGVPMRTSAPTDFVFSARSFLRFSQPRRCAMVPSAGTAASLATAPSASSASSTTS